MDRPNSDAQSGTMAVVEWRGLQPGHRLLALGRGDQALIVWDAARGQNSSTCRGHPRSCSAGVLAQEACSPLASADKTVNSGTSQTRREHAGLSASRCVKSLAN